MKKKLILIFKKGNERFEKDLKLCTVEYLQYMKSKGFYIIGRVTNG